MDVFYDSRNKISASYLKFGDESMGDIKKN